MRSSHFSRFEKENQESKSRVYVKPSSVSNIKAGKDRDKVDRVHEIIISDLKIVMMGHYSRQHINSDSRGRKGKEKQNQCKKR